MPGVRRTARVEFDEELWELVVAEADHAGVSVSEYVRDAVVARLIVGPTDPRVFEVFAAAVREAARDEPHDATRRGAERSLSVVARLGASRRRSEAQALRAQSAQIIRMSQQRQRHLADAESPPQPDAAPESAFRISADWGEIRPVSSRPPSADGDAPDVTWLEAEHIHPEDVARVRDAVANATERRAMLDLSYRVRFGADTHQVHLRALPLLDAAGTIPEWVAVAAESPYSANA
jgi:hypothetical protein